MISSLRNITKIVFKQKPSDAYPSRTKTLNFDFVNHFDCSDSWEDLSNKGKIIIPKNVYVRDGFGKLVPLGGTNVNIGGFDSNIPLFLRGDEVTIESGYKYFDAQKNEKTSTNPKFSGFVTQVGSRKPIELEVQDNMWRLKQVIAKNKTYKETDTLETILKDLLQGTGFTVNALTSTTFGAFMVQNETVAEVLARLRKDYHFESYFRGNELRCGALVYVEQDAIDDGQKKFTFQDNIISDELEYRRKDDINLSAIAYSINKKELSFQTKDGKTKTRKERLEVLVNVRNGKYVSSVKQAGSKADFAPSTAGERRTLYFWNVTSADKLIELATAELKKYYYSGFRGHFETFDLPFVRQGDNVDIIDAVLPERNGRYKVKKVEYSGGVDGHRQNVYLDFLITALDAKGNAI